MNYCLLLLNFCDFLYVSHVFCRILWLVVFVLCCLWVVAIVIMCFCRMLWFVFVFCVFVVVFVILWYVSHDFVQNIMIVYVFKFVVYLFMFFVVLSTVFCKIWWLCLCFCCVLFCICVTSLRFSNVFLQYLMGFVCWYVFVCTLFVILCYFLMCSWKMLWCVVVVFHVFLNLLCFCCLFIALFVRLCDVFLRVRIISIIVLLVLLVLRIVMFIIVEHDSESFYIVLNCVAVLVIGIQYYSVTYCDLSRFLCITVCAISIEFAIYLNTFHRCTRFVSQNFLCVFTQWTCHVFRLLQ